MNFKYTGLIDVIDHIIVREVEKGTEIKLNGKKMQSRDVFQPNDVITVKDKTLIERLKATGVYEQINTPKKEKEKIKGD